MARTRGWLWALLLLYVAARVCQLFAGRIPTLAIVILHVIPPALFAVIHGSVLYGRRGIAAFACLCLGIGTLAETVALRTGFPFGSYYFTDVMGPKVFQLPVLLTLAYLGIGYAAWVVAVLILDCAGKPIRGSRVVLLPLLASVAMVSWDAAMDPNWSLLDHAWTWRKGGAYFGVPVSNYLGWLLTAYSYYQGFALYCRWRAVKTPAMSRGFWLPAILLYATCAAGNLLLPAWPMAPPVVTDAVGRQWATADILAACAAVSILVMAPLALLAWLRTRRMAD